MNRIIFIILLAPLLSACNHETDIVDYAILSGEIKNSSADEVEITDYNYLTYFVVRRNSLVKTIKVEDDGTFQDTLYNTGDKTYQLKIGSRPLIYLRDGYNLHMTADMNDFDNTLTFSGIGSEPNNFNQLKERLGKSFNADFRLSEKLYIAKKDSVKNVLEAALNKISNEAAFVEAEQFNIECHRLYSLYTYQSWHRSFTKDTSFEVSSDFPMKQISPELIDGFDYNNEKKYNQSIFYRNIENLRIRNNIKQIANKENLHYTDAKIEYLRRNTNLHESLVYSQLTTPLQNFSMKDIEGTNELYQKLMAFAKGKDKLEAKIQNYYDEVMAEAKKLGVGQPSPKFVNYENYHGGTSSLDDYKGKYVFIDFWATWCGPCLKQIPHLKKIEEKYHNHNIVFIGISTDKQKDKSKWREYVEKYEMGGEQLLTDKSSYSDFYQDYGIKSIPRFILIDPNGNIVSSESPYPSDPKLIELLESLEL